ncbi:hypothetical protein KFE98_20515 [bacterium SCSIO 12741]|nr:hypothetical protein KFE98_20515 [bacterium SCSIO 12741]
MTTEQQTYRTQLVNLIEQENSKRQAQKIAELIAQKPELFSALVDLFLNASPTLSMRASYVAEFVYLRDTSLVEPHIEFMARHVLDFPHTGTQRNLLKILARCPLPKENLGYLLQACFDLVENAITPPAVKVWSLELLYRIGLQEPEINGELRLILEALYETGSAGEKVRSRDILKKMNH